MLHIDTRGAAAPLALLFDQPGNLQFTQQLTGLLLAAAQVGLYGCDRVIEIDAAMLVQPTLLHGKIHTVQQEPVQKSLASVETRRYCGSVIRGFGTR